MEGVVIRIPNRGVHIVRKTTFPLSLLGLALVAIFSMVYMTRPAQAELFVDTTAPTVTVTATPAIAGGTTSVVTISAALADDVDLGNYRISIDGNEVQPDTAISGVSSTITFEWNVTLPKPATSGAHIVTVYVTDAAGNTGQDQATVQVDNDGPIVGITGDGLIKTGSIAPKVTATDESSVAAYEWKASESNPATIAFTATDKESSFTPTVEGSYVFYLTVKDGLGNVSPVSSFTFDYKRELELVPLPVSSDPTDKLITTSLTSPTITPASATAVARDIQSDTSAKSDKGVLGSTVSTPASVLPIPGLVTTIAPTNNGWSVFGVLWYWWFIAASLVVIAWRVIKKITTSRVAEQS